MKKRIKSIKKYINCVYRDKLVKNNFIEIIKYNNKFNSDKKVKFVDIKFLYNKLNLQLLAHNLITSFKKQYINKIKNVINKILNTNIANKFFFLLNAYK